MYNGLVSVDIFCAKDLKRTNFSKRHSITGRTDVINAYIVVNVDGITVFKTVSSKENYLTWNKSSKFMVDNGRDLQIIIFEKGIAEDQYIADLSLEMNKDIERQWVELNPFGKLFMTIQFDPNGEMSDTEIVDTSPTTLLKRKGIAIGQAFKRKVMVFNDHRFMMTYFRQPTFCSVCKGFIWGITKKQGYQCRLCAMVTHCKCYEFIVVNCCQAAREGSSPIGNGFKIDVPHNFEVYNYKTPTMCKHCGSLLYGLYKQGLRCTNCKMNIHKRCKEYIPNHCGINVKDLAQTMRMIGLSTDVSSIKKSMSNFVSPSNVITLDNFDLKLVLGEGSFGKVFLGTNKASGSQVAIKAIKKSIIDENEDYESLIAERDCLLLGNECTFLGRLVCSFQDKGYAFLVMEYYSGGDMMFHFQKHGVFTETMAAFYLGQVVLGLVFLHERNIIYRDLKLDNLMMDSEGYIKLVDFGMSKKDTGNENLTFCGTPDYIAPEILIRRPYGLSVDWWAFGVLAYEILVGQPPFDGDYEEELFSNIMHQKIIIPKRLSSQAKEILVKFMVRNPEKRMGCKGNEHEIFKLNFFYLNWDDLKSKKIPSPIIPKLGSCNFDQCFTSKNPKLSKNYHKKGTTNYINFDFIN